MYETIHTGTLETAGPALLKVDSISKSYFAGTVENKILKDLSLEVGAGEFVSIVGPSGVGKTTLLRCLSGLIKTEQGSVAVSGEVISGPHPDIGVVFQDYSRSLMPWMTTQDNVAFPLEGKGVGKKERFAKADVFSRCF